MSRSWSGGSTRQWRKVRALVLERDGFRCQLRLDGCTHVATQVHHTLGKTVTGDDPAHLVSACRHCNLSLGSPAQLDPRPTPRTKWTH